MLLVADDRLIHTAICDTGGQGGEEFDFCKPRTVGSVRIDYAFTEIIRPPAGQTTIRLPAPTAPERPRAGERVPLG